MELNSYAGGKAELKIKSDLMSVVVAAVAIVMLIASTPTANLSFFLIAAYALRGRAQAILALGLSWLFTMISPGIAAETTLGAAGRYTVLAAAALSVLLRSRPSNMKPMTWWTLLLGGALVWHSFLFSPIVDVSVLKAALWTTAMITVIAAWAGLSAQERSLVTVQLFGGLAIVAVVSVPLVALPLGYLRNGTGFQGILSHPQAMGPTMALLGAWAAAQMLERKQPPWSAVVLTVLCLALILLSEARTAGIALVLGLGVAISLAPLLSRQKITPVLPGLRSRKMVLVMLSCVSALLLGGPILGDRIAGYIAKRGEATSLAEAYHVSRGVLIDPMLDNISNDPWQGIGFGISSVPDAMVVDRDPVFGLPTGASIEKGVMPIAVLEEVGIPGFLAVAMWIWVLLRRSSRRGVASLGVALTVLFLNLGEYTFFSPNGFGLLPIILLGWACSSGQTELVARRDGLALHQKAARRV